MSNKLDAKVFITELLSQAGCTNIKSGQENINCSCPYHNPRKNTNSFGISFVKEDEGYPFHCLSGKCNENGNIFKLISHINKCSYKKAQKIFEKRVLIKPININVLRELCDNIKYVNDNMQEKKVVTFPQPSKNLKPMMEYLRWRNENKQHNIMNLKYIIERYELYYCAEGRYTNRIIMPITDLDGDWVQFNDRIIDHNAKNKSLHEAGSDFTNYLHGIKQAYGKRKCILVEGSFDMYQVVSVLLKRNDLKSFACICNMGTAMNEERSALLTSVFDEIYLLLDNDEAGREATWKMKCVLDNDLEVKCITTEIPRDKDPAICTGGQIVKAIKCKHKLKLITYVSHLNNFTRQS